MEANLITGSFGGGLDEQARGVKGEVEADLRVPRGLDAGIPFPWMWREGQAFDWTVG